MEHLFCSKRKHVEEKERSFCQLAILSGMTKLIYDRENNKLWTDGKSKHIYLHLPMEFSSWQDGGGTKGRLMCNAGWNVGQFQWWPEVRGYSIEFLLWLRPCSRRLCCQLQIYEVSCRQTHALATTHALTTSVWRGCWSSATLSAFAKLSYQWASGARVVCRRHPSTAYEDDYND